MSLQSTLHQPALRNLQTALYAAQAVVLTADA